MSILTYFIGTMSSRQKIINVHGAFPKKAFQERKNVFGQNIYGEVILIGRTNDQIISRWGGVS